MKKKNALRKLFEQAATEVTRDDLNMESMTDAELEQIAAQAKHTVRDAALAELARRKQHKSTQP
jgi:hypothetical protein